MPSSPNEVVLLYLGPRSSTQPETFRIIPLDDRKHEPDAAKDWTYYGRSIGYWEGDTLVVDSVGFNEVTWLARGGYFHSDQMRVIERFRREGNVLHHQATVEDPVVLLPRWTLKTGN